jgi:hypothetical protein
MADPVWWNLDSFLAETIALNLRDYIKHSAGAPGEYTEEQWFAKLDSIATRLEAYLNRFDSADLEVDRVLVESAKEAMHELADVFPALWD